MSFLRGIVLFAVVAFLTSATSLAVEPQWIGKIVSIKTAKETRSCIVVENSVPRVTSSEGKPPEASQFNVVAGTEPGTVCFESVAQPGTYLRHQFFHLTTGKKVIKDTSFLLDKPLVGNQGLSLQACNFPTHHLVLTEQGHIELLDRPKDPRKGVFFLVEVKSR